jgi:hypothetical protein
MTDKRKMLLKILKVKSDMLKIYNKIPAPFNKGLKPNMDITKLIKYFERMK